jgi:hypothetical protein
MFKKVSQNEDALLCGLIKLSPFARKIDFRQFDAEALPIITNTSWTVLERLAYVNKELQKKLELEEAKVIQNIRCYIKNLIKDYMPIQLL